MCCRTSTWNCTSCGLEGNIITLIEYAKHNDFGKVYTPKREQKLLYQSLDLLLKKYPGEKHLLNVKDKVASLIKYYEKAP